jgi:hypothetical protein
LRSAQENKERSTQRIVRRKNNKEVTTFFSEPGSDRKWIAQEMQDEWAADRGKGRYEEITHWDSDL